MNKDFEGNFKSLLALSMPDEHEQNQFGKSPVLEKCPQAKNVEGIDFDAIREKWYPSQEGKNVPCSVDALVFQDDRIYLIEFKAGALKHLERKIYDSVMMLIEHGCLDFQKMRQKATYIVVASTWEKDQNCKKSTSRAGNYGKSGNVADWDNDNFMKSYDNWGLYTLEGVIVEKRYCMPPNMFENFVKSKKWS